MSDKHDQQARMPEWFAWLLQMSIVILLPLVLAIGSGRLVMNTAFLRFEYERAGFPDDPFGFTTEDRLRLGPHGIDYLIHEEPIAYLGDLHLAGDLCYPPSEMPCPAFNADELAHMHDVQDVAQGLFRFGLWAGLFLSVCLVIVGRWHSRVLLGHALLRAAMLTIGLLVTVVLLAITAWDTFFGGFHRLFFADGTWQFYYSDTLIRLYPEQFWFDASLAAGGLILLGAIVILGIGWRWCA